MRQNIEETKYNVPLTEEEALVIGRMRSGKKRVNFSGYFFPSVILTAILIIVLTRYTRNAALAFLGFSPMIAYFILNSRNSRRINKEADDFVKQVKESQ